MAGPDSLKPKPSGKIELPTVDAGMNRKGPKLSTVADDKDNGEVLGWDNDEDSDSKEVILERARVRFDRCVEWESDLRIRELDDQKFKRGRVEDQWPDYALNGRQGVGVDIPRPCLVINKMKTFVHQVTNDLRLNRPSINFSPVDDRADVDAAKMFKGIVRRIEQDSAADIAYDTAVDSAVSIGEGYFRILTEYDREDSFDQVIRIKRVRNRFTIYLDPDHQEPEGSDSKFGFVTEMIPREEFKRDWPDADPMLFSAQAQGDPSFRNWSDSNHIRIAEYFEVKTVIRTLVELESGHIGFKDELDPEVLKEIARYPNTVVSERDSDCAEIKWYKITAVDILERNDWPGRWIPIVKVIGDEVDVEGKVEYSGIIRDAKDAQRMVNYWNSMEAELVALAPKAPFIAEEGQLEGHEDEWAQANVKSFPVLQYKGTSIAGSPAPPPQRQPSVQIPAGVVQAKQGAEMNMQATTGIRFDASMQERMQDESGKAIRELRRSGDLGSLHYGDNLGRSLRHAGRIYLDLIPKVLTRKQVVTILRDDDKEEQITIDPRAPKAYSEAKHPQTGKTMKIFNPTIGRFGITVTLGPNYATRRIEAAESMMAFAKALPNVAQLIADLIAKNMDWDGAEEMATRLAKAVPAQLLTADQKDIPPQVQAVLQNYDAQVKQLTEALKKAMAELQSNDKDRAIAQDKIDKDFEAKLLSVVQKVEASFDEKVGRQLENLATGVRELMEGITSPKKDEAAKT